MAGCAPEGELAPAPPLVAVAASRLELELELAGRPELYLVLSPRERTLEVKARGLALARVPVEGVDFLGLGAEGGSVALPAVWTVAAEPSHVPRHEVKPKELRPYGEEPPSADEPPAPVLEIPQPPRRYRVPLDRGWALEVGQTVPRRGIAGRGLTAMVTGWNRWIGREEANPPSLLVLRVDPAEAERLHHLFRPGLAIVVVAD